MTDVLDKINSTCCAVCSNQRVGGTVCRVGRSQCNRHYETCEYTKDKHADIRVSCLTCTDFKFRAPIEGTASDDAIALLFRGTDFGGSEKTDVGRRGLLSECVLKRAAGYHDGHTIVEICKAAGLLSYEGNPTSYGLRWSFDQLYKPSSKTILERLKR